MLFLMCWKVLKPFLPKVSLAFACLSVYVCVCVRACVYVCVSVCLCECVTVGAFAVMRVPPQSCTDCQATQDKVHFVSRSGTHGPRQTMDKSVALFFEDEHLEAEYGGLLPRQVKKLLRQSPFVFLMLVRVACCWLYRMTH
jgi:hypothetical protein